MKKIECIECGKVLAMIEKGKVRPHIKAHCNKCFDRIFNDGMETLKADLPSGFSEIFGMK